MVSDTGDKIMNLQEQLALEEKKRKLKELNPTWSDEAVNAALGNNPRRTLGIGESAGASEQFSSTGVISPEVKKEFKTTLQDKILNTPPSSAPGSVTDSAPVKLETASGSASGSPKPVAAPVEKSLGRITEIAKGLQASKKGLTEKNSPWLTKLEAKEAEFNQLLKDAQSMAKDKEDRTETAALIEKLGQAFTLIGAGLYGNKTGVDAITGVKFISSDWEKKLDRIQNGLKIDIQDIQDRRSNALGEAKLSQGEQEKREGLAASSEEKRLDREASAKESQARLDALRTKDEDKLTPQEKIAKEVNFKKATDIQNTLRLISQQDAKAPIKFKNPAEEQSFHDKNGIPFQPYEVMTFGEDKTNAANRAKFFEDRRAKEEALTAEYENILANPLVISNKKQTDSVPSKEAKTGTVKMMAPNGEIKEVLPDAVEKYKAMGAKVVK